MSTFDSLDKTFDVASTELVKAQRSITKKVKKEFSCDAEEDYDYVRGMLKSSAEALSEITSNAMGVAEQSDHPRAFEVAANAAKQTSEVVEKIMALHKDVKELDEVQQAKVNEVKTQNNVFISGSTADLLKQLKEGGAL